MEISKPTCFVIQEFDNGGTYDKRYQETIKPALINADVEPQRADKILGLQPVIQKIEEAIMQASICIAEVSTDNLNVWFELGYALANNRPVVILCDKHIRSKLPFNIQHRPVIFYRTDSKSGYEELEQQIILNVKNELEKDESIPSGPIIKGGADQLEDLKDYEVGILSALLAMWPTNTKGSSHWEITTALRGKKYNETALGLGIANLIKKGLIDQDTEVDGHEEFFIYRITQRGITWLDERKEYLDLTQETSEETSEFVDDDIPF